MRLLLLALAALVGACTTVQPPGGRLRVVDLTGDFDRIATEIAPLPDGPKVAAFEAKTAGLAENFYARSRNPQRYDEHVLAALNSYPAERAGILDVSRRFRAMLEPARAKFEKALGKVESERPIFLLHSLGEMDGGTRELAGGETLIFGADVIAKIHAGHDMAPFFHHELFHVYHSKRFGQCEPLWCSLWQEGLATHVAATLNPAAGDAALMLDLPAPIRPVVDANRKAAVCAVAPLLDSTRGDDYASLFYGSSHLPGFPARMGYYIGYLIAADAARTHSLRQLAELRPAEVRPIIAAAMQRLADCP
jgi:hypothetical protein